jgi:hypothetical protein
MYSPDSSVFDLPFQPDSTRKPHETWDGGNLSVTDDVDVGHVSDGNSHSEPSFVVISGGSGGNSICTAFDNACFVLPVSDDGGSSSEIIRVLGGPSIGGWRASSSTRNILMHISRRRSLKARQIDPSGPSRFASRCRAHPFILQIALERARK